ncbi:MAG: tetratricopeptide repeat protein, partial [Verrucomicrobia bacterium]|nr:tetratricopeptide repeat protein [Verrucomicrobiota bacterium]
MAPRPRAGVARRRGAPARTVEGGEDDVRQVRNAECGMRNGCRRCATMASALLLLSLITPHSSLCADITGPPPKLYNEGNAAYRLKQFEDAAKAYQQSLVSKDAALQERAFYNLGNAYYRQGDPLEAQTPEKAMELFKQSVSCYDSALALDPKDEDAAFNKQLVDL